MRRETPPRQGAHPTPCTLSRYPQMLNQGSLGHTTGAAVGQPPELCRGSTQGGSRPRSLRTLPKLLAPLHARVRSLGASGPSGRNPLALGPFGDSIHLPAQLPVDSGTPAHCLRTSSPAPNSYKICWAQAGLALPATAESGLSPVTSTGGRLGGTLGHPLGQV